LLPTFKVPYCQFSLGGWLNVDLVFDSQPRLRALREIDRLIPEILGDYLA